MNRKLTVDSSSKEKPTVTRAVTVLRAHVCIRKGV